MASHRIAVIPGDGIGPEVVSEGLRVLDRVASLHGFEIRRQARTTRSEVDSELSALVKRGRQRVACTFGSGLPCVPGLKQ